LKESTITPKMISRPIAETCPMETCQAPLGRRGVRPAAAGRAKGHAPLRPRDGGVSDRDRVRDRGKCEFRHPPNLLGRGAG